MDKKPSTNTTETPPPSAPAKKKNLSLDISDVTELERKISPSGIAPSC